MMRRAPLLVAVALVGAAIVAVVATLPVAPTLAAPVVTAASTTGVAHPITAVLLGFRAYDTLLEVAVVLLAVRIAVGGEQAPPMAAAVDPLTSSLARWLVPLTVLVAAYLLWAGSQQPGGAFQAAALAAGAGIGLKLAGLWPSALLNDMHWRWLQSVGLIIFLAIGSAPMAFGATWLAWPPDWAKAAILMIEMALAVSIAAGLLSLFAASPSDARR